MPASESDILAARLVRMHALIESLERVRTDTSKQQELFATLKKEMAAARAALHTVLTSPD